MHGGGGALQHARAADSLSVSQSYAGPLSAHHDNNDQTTAGLSGHKLPLPYSAPSTPRHLDYTTREIWKLNLDNRWVLLTSVFTKHSTNKAFEVNKMIAMPTSPSSFWSQYPALHTPTLCSARNPNKDLPRSPYIAAVDTFWLRKSISSRFYNQSSYLMYSKVYTYFILNISNIIMDG